jgi:hypothetical protein
MKVRALLFLVVLAFSVTLAVVVGLRLSDQAMAVVVGVVAGVAASIPTSLIVVWFATRQIAAETGRRDRDLPRAREPELPRIVVVPPQPPVASPYHDAAYRPAPPPPAINHGRRSFTIIGGDEDP